MGAAIEGSVKSRLTHLMETNNNHWKEMDLECKNYNSKVEGLWEMLVEKMTKVFNKMVYLCNNRKPFGEGFSPLLFNIFYPTHYSELCNFKKLKMTKKLDVVHTWNNMMWDQLKRNKYLDTYFYDDDKDYEELIENLTTVQYLTGLLYAK